MADRTVDSMVKTLVLVLVLVGPLLRLMQIHQQHRLRFGVGHSCMMVAVLGSLQLHFL